MLQAVPLVASMQWHPGINQIFAGCGGRTGGCVRTFYDPKLSTKGAVVAASRAPRTINTDFMQVSLALVGFNTIVAELGHHGLPQQLDMCAAHLRGIWLLQLAAPTIYNPNALPMYRDESMPGRPVGKKRRLELEAEKRKYQPAGSSMAKGNDSLLASEADCQACCACIPPALKPRSWPLLACPL